MWKWISPLMEPLWRPWQSRAMPLWQSLQPREQKALLALMAAIVVLIVFLAVIKPAHQAAQQAWQKQQKAEQAWRNLVKQAKQVQNLQQQGNAATAQVTLTSASQLLALLQKQLRQARLTSALKQISPANSSSRKVGYQVVLKSAPAPQVFQWLDALEQMGLTAAQFKIETQSKGVVDVSAKFEVAL
jgi:type II secretory pathway component PulM